MSWTPATAILPGMSLGEPAARRPPVGGGTITVLLGLMLGLVVWRFAPPAAVDASAPADRFSAERAAAVLRRVLGDGAPHPLGSPANARVRDAVVAELTALGLTPRVEPGFACNGYGVCSAVENVVARIGEHGAGKAVLLAAHYDSVPAGPGASDDGVGVAALVETARALRAGAPLGRDVVLLVDDGEEAGLLGAEAFAATPLARDIGAVVNLEARGTSGGSLMFELRRDSGWVVRRLAAALERPLTNSVFATIYQRMPNDTDFTVFRRAGVPGANFAFVGDVLRYHTPQDDLAHLDLGSLQHQGDNALAMVRAFAGANLEQPPAGDAVFFDLLGTIVVRWPERWGLALAAAGLLLLGIAARGWHRRGALGPRGALRAFLAALLLPVLAAAVGIAWLYLLRKAGAVSAPWVAHPTPARLAFWGLALAVALLLGRRLGRRTSLEEAWVGSTLAFLLLGGVLAAVLPGPSYLFLAPALVGAVVALPWAAGLGRGALAVLLGTAMAMAVLLPFAWMLDEALGSMLLPGVAALVALALVPALPAFLTPAPRGLLAAVLVGVLVASGIAFALPKATADHPQPENLLYAWDSAKTSGQWVAAGEHRPTGMGLPSFAAVRERRAPWAAPAWVASATGPALAAPELVRLEERPGPQGMRTLRLLLRSPRGAPRARLALPPDAPLLGAKVEGTAVPLERLRRGGTQGWTLLQFPWLPAAGLTIELELKSAAPVAIEVEDVSPGLPAEGAALIAARGATRAPIGGGDTTVSVTRAAF